MDISISEILGRSSSITALEVGSKASIILWVIMAIVGLLMCFLGLKLIRIWNVLVGLVVGAGVGAVVAWILGQEGMINLALVGGGALLLAILSGIFKRFGVFVYTLVSMFFLAVRIKQPSNWIWVAVCGAIGLIMAIMAMLIYEAFVIIVTALNGAHMAGSAAVGLAGITNIYLCWGIIVGLAVIGMIIQFMCRGKEVGKHEIEQANVIKEETSKAQEIEHLRALLDEEDED